MSDRLSSALGGLKPQPNVDSSQHSESKSGLKTPEGSVVLMGPGEKVAGSTPPTEYAALEIDDMPLEGHELQTSHSEAFAASPHRREDSDDSVEADPEMEPSIALDEQPEDSSPPPLISDTAEPIELLEHPIEPQSEPASPSPVKHTGIDVDTHDWQEIMKERIGANEEIRYDQSHGQRLTRHWIQQIENIQYKISRSPDKEQCGRKCIAEAYIQSFFPEIKRGNEEYKNKVRQIEEMLAHGTSKSVGHQIFSTEGHEKTSFFNQVIGPMRQLIIFTFAQKALPEDSEALQDFFEKFVIFNMISQTTIAAVANLKNSEHFGAPPITCKQPNPLGDTFGEARTYFLQWMGDDTHPSDPYECDAVNSDCIPDEEDGKESKLGRFISVYGKIDNSAMNILFVGSDIFKECITEAQRLKENKDDPEALAAFTLAIKKLMYVWSQSTTCIKGQTAILEMLIDSIAQYAGFKLESLKIPEEIKTVLENLTEDCDPSDPDNQDYSGYYGQDEESNEEFLKEFYHANTFALYMDSFEKFNQRYPCTFAPINSEMDEISPEMDGESTLQQIFQPETQPLATPVDSVSSVQPPEPSPELASPPATAHTGIDVDRYNWNLEQVRNICDQKRREEIIFTNRCPRPTTENAQNTIKSSSNKAECGRQYIAETYIDLFFPEITKGSQYISKMAEIEQRLINERNEQADLRTLTPGNYGDESFFQQTAGPLRQLITDAFEHQALDTDNDSEVQIFFEKIVHFSAIARGAIAAVTNSENMERFGDLARPLYGTSDTFKAQFKQSNSLYNDSLIYLLHPQASDDIQKLKAQLNAQLRMHFFIDYDMISPNESLHGYANYIGEPFDISFSESQNYLARWLATDLYPLDPSQWDTLKLGQQANSDYQKRSQFGCAVRGNGYVDHSYLSMLHVGSGIFKECMEEAKRLKENQNDPEALAAFTQAIKKFMYTWSQSTTCDRGQAAMLMMLVDSMAKYAGCQLKRPEVPEEARTALAQLTERFPDSNKIEGSETETGYAVRTQRRNARGEKCGESIDILRKNDEKWLQDLYYHYDVFALLMPSFAAFDERYKCEFVPLPTNETPPETT
ncbi:MAG: hypothetical protein LBF34_03630 [Puniceicoccales bacterium]|jgi:hypothetical protein|nr:hypothetical protein [Puniceicoccales bacterium]